MAFPSQITEAKPNFSQRRQTRQPLAVITAGDTMRFTMKRFLTTTNATRMAGVVFIVTMI